MTFLELKIKAKEFAKNKSAREVYQDRYAMAFMEGAYMMRDTAFGILDYNSEQQFGMGKTEKARFAAELSKEIKALGEPR